jgi:hypothetical protein
LYRASLFSCLRQHFICRCDVLVNLVYLLAFAFELLLQFGNDFVYIVKPGLILCFAAQQRFELLLRLADPVGKPVFLAAEIIAVYVYALDFVMKLCGVSDDIYYSGFFVLQF